jgi:asparagine synthase (glutamine-hydrolysing)
VTDPATGATTEKWILRKACEDPLPAELNWRKKPQFDEGSGTVAALDRALSGLTGDTAPIDREHEAALYERLLRAQYLSPELILANAGTWTADRVAI